MDGDDQQNHRTMIGCEADFSENPGSPGSRGLERWPMMSGSARNGVPLFKGKPKKPCGSVHVKQGYGCFFWSCSSMSHFGIFWGYWTSLYSSHLVDHIPNGWVMWNMGTWLMTHVKCVCVADDLMDAYWILDDFGWTFRGQLPEDTCSESGPQVFTHLQPRCQGGSEFSLSKKSESQVNSHDLENYCYNSLWLRFHVFFIISTIMNCFGDVFLMFLSCAFIRWHIITSPM